MLVIGRESVERERERERERITGESLLLQRVLWWKEREGFRTLKLKMKGSEDWWVPRNRHVMVRLLRANDDHMVFHVCICTNGSRFCFMSWVCVILTFFASLISNGRIGWEMSEMVDALFFCLNSVLNTQGSPIYKWVILMCPLFLLPASITSYKICSFAEIDWRSDLK